MTLLLWYAYFRFTRSALMLVRKASILGTPWARDA